MLCDPRLATPRGPFEAYGRKWYGPLFHLEGEARCRLRGSVA